MNAVVGHSIDGLLENDGELDWFRFVQRAVMWGRRGGCRHDHTRITVTLGLRDCLILCTCRKPAQLFFREAIINEHDRSSVQGLRTPDQRG